MARLFYALALLAVAMPLGIVAALALLPRLAPSLVNVPNARAWLAPPHRDETLATLGMRGAVCAILVTAFICAVHLLIVRANATSPNPRAAHPSPPDDRSSSRA